MNKILTITAMMALSAFFVVEAGSAATLKQKASAHYEGHEGAEDLNAAAPAPAES
jgi:hypothetical protein